MLLLWVVFLVFQQVKSRHDRCSAVYLTLFAVELLLLIAFTGLGLLPSWPAFLAVPVSRILFMAARLHRPRSASPFACFSCFPGGAILQDFCL